MFSLSARLRLAAAAVVLAAVAATPSQVEAAEYPYWGACGMLDCNQEMEGLQRNQCYWEEPGAPTVCDCRC